MILSALTQLYYDLVNTGKIPAPGWVTTKISYALNINEDGELVDIIPMLEETMVGKKKVLLPYQMELPAPVKRTSGFLPNFLWDNSSYLLGIDNKGKPIRALECFFACKKFHHELLDGVNNPISNALLRFFDKWDPETAAEHPVLKPYLKEVTGIGNLMFIVDGVFPQEDEMIRLAWQTHYEKSEGELAPCLVTGEMDTIAAVHPSIKGVSGAQSSGAALVSFNAPAFCSYNKEQGYNAPIGKKAAFAYTSALNYLLADRKNVQHIGDTTVVCWAEGADPVYRDFSLATIFDSPMPNEVTRDELRIMVRRIAHGLPCTEFSLDPDKTFYILGLAPNAARISVRFFYKNSFGNLMKNVNDHYERLEIVGNRHSAMPLWFLLKETANANLKDSSPSPILCGATTNAILKGTPYPAALLTSTMLRIRAEQRITPGRAAILKAYFLKNPDSKCPKEVLTVSLNAESTNIPYTLGRLFYVYESIQKTAIPNINTSIADKYFGSAAATPSLIFPILDNLCQKHLRKLDIGLRIYYQRQIGALKNILGEENPKRLSIEEQGSFYLGYYHQKEARFMKKEDNES